MMSNEALKKRRSLTPPIGTPAVGGSPSRRATTRREVSERVCAKLDGGRVLEGWALNVSRGGLRVILEGDVELGEEVEITVGDMAEAPLTRRGRVVWLQEERDGAIVGIEFLNVSGTHKSVPPAPPTTE